MRSRSSSIKTTGDAIQDRPLSEAGGKGLFVKEIEEALLARRIDVAVHSMKDMPTAQPAGPRDRRLPAARGCARRADRRRRQAHRRPARTAPSSAPRRCAGAPSSCTAGPTCRSSTCAATSRRGCAKRAAGEVEATLLALAGLKRLGLDHVGTPVPEDEMLPAVGQGAVCIECRADDAKTRGWLAAINHGPTATCVKAEHAHARRARRLVPHADCRPCGSHRRRASSARPDRQARRLAS